MFRGPQGRAALIAVVVSGLAGAHGCGRGTSDTSTRLRIGLDFTVSGYHAPWFVAQEEGFFLDEGLDVVISRGFGSGETVRQLAAGAFDVGFANPAPIIIAISEGQPLRIVMSYFVNEMCSLYSYAEHGNVRSLSDLQGKTWGDLAGNVCGILREPLTQAAGVDLSSITLLNMAVAARIPALVQGSIDVTGSFYDWDVLFEQAGAAAGLTLVTVRYSEFLSLYSNSIFVTAEFAEEHPDAVTGFVRALRRGLEYSIRNPDQAATIVRTRFPELDSVYVDRSVRLLATAAVDTNNASRPLGYIDARRMEETIETVVRLWHLPSPPEPQDVYTNRFVSPLGN